ncbi:MAG TPA: twin-arginine translocase TatA/TatE family subunit, partial [Sphingomicrobium sp.]|nr:twin-arginine translocase TatA/TatE family subunit [Sphingomicrobium sp.]
MGGFSLWHILIFAIIVLLLFGGNRFSNMMGDVAKGLKSFKQGLADDEKPAEPKQIAPQASQTPIDITPSRPAEPTQTPPPSGDDQSR